MTSTSCSAPSSRRRAAAWGSACSSAARSSSDIRAACGPSRTRTGPARRSRSRSLGVADVVRGRAAGTEHVVMRDAPAGLDRRRRRLGPRVVAGPAAAGRICRGSVLVGRGVPRLGSPRRDQLPPSRRRHARDVRPRPARGTGAPAPRDPDRLHHRRTGIRPCGRASLRAGPSSVFSSRSARQRCSTRSTAALRTRQDR